MPEQTSLETEACALWSQLWSMFYQIDDSKWAEQAPRLRELCRLSSALTQVCDAMQKEKASDEAL